MTLETEDNGTLATADVLSNGQELKGQIATSSDIDFYKIGVGQAGVISLSFDAPTDSSYTDYFAIGLYNSSGTLLGGNDILRGGSGTDTIVYGDIDTIEDFNVFQGDKIHFKNENNDSSNVTYSSSGNDTVITWKNLSVTVEDFASHDQIAQHIEWIMIG